MEKKKKRRGDRRDARLVREADTMHKFMPFHMPRRTANEAMMNETVDLTAVNEYLEKKNAENPAFRYTIFHVIAAAIGKTVLLRPRMNRFYVANRYYERNEVSLSFVVRKKLNADSEEGLAIVHIRPEDGAPLEQLHSQVEKIVHSVRGEQKNDGATDFMDILVKFPRPILKFILWCLRTLDYFDLYPKSMMSVDPYYTSVFLSNLGSIRMHANYHHLAEWGTNSVFAIIGEKKPTPFFHADGTFEVKEALELGLTVDERIADGYYFAKSIRLLKKLLENPELLELPADTPVETE